MFGVNIFEELEDDVGIMKGFSFVGESGNQSFGITSFVRQAKAMAMQVGKCGASKRNVVVERIGFDVFLANPAFL